MTKYKYALGVFIGRFCFFHDGHNYVIDKTAEQCAEILIVLGSANAARRPDYVPFTVKERTEMIMGSIDPELHDRIHIVGVEDHENMVDWITQVQKEANDILDRSKHSGAIALSGMYKDQSSYYLKSFPEWDSIEVADYNGVSATPHRTKYFEPDCSEDDIDQMPIPDFMVEWLIDFQTTPQYANLVDEWAEIKRGKKQWETAPYEPIFVTVDSVVIQGAYVLMVERGGNLGKGLLACPGGFIEPQERVEDGIFRELIEETKIKVPLKILKRSLVATKYFDNPYRSSRGRTITFAGLIHLEPEVPEGITDKNKIANIIGLPKVKGSDDAKRAFWMPIDDLKREDCFEDHYSIIMTMKAFLSTNKA